MSLFVQHKNGEHKNGGLGSEQPTHVGSSLQEPLVDVEEAARIQLQHSPYRALRRVTCEFFNGTLLLRGCVATYHYKQLAQVSVAEIAGVQRIVNLIDVEATLRDDRISR